MGIYDRNYSRGNFNQQPVRLVLPPMTPVVKLLLIANIVVFVLSLVPQIGKIFMVWFSVFPENLAMSLQLWRLLTYQFLHGDIFHIFFNMLILYFFGPILERLWASKRFLIFYLSCGAMGGILYPVLVGLGFLEAGPMIGASGAIYGMLAAMAIMYPKMQVLVFGIFPVPLGILAIIMAFISFLGLMGGPNAGGEAAHLSGMAAGAVYVLWKPWLEKSKFKAKEGSWERKMQKEKDFQARLDEILDKVHRSGLSSLTRKEKKILKEATRREKG